MVDTDLAAATAPGAAPRAPRRAVPRRRAAAVLGALLLLATVLHVGHVARYTKVSPVDELQHLDYLIRAPRGDIPGSGDLFLQESARIQTCARIDEGFDANVPPCVTDPSVVLDVRRFQESGFNTAFIHPPTYYVVDGVAARVIDAVVPGDQSLLTTGRLAALLWALGAVVALWLLLAELRAGLAARAAAIVLVVSAPTVLHGTATVNPDGTSIAVGAALLWAVLRWERGRLSRWVPVGLVALATLTKVTNLAAVGVVVLYLLASEWWARRSAAPEAAPDGSHVRPRGGWWPPTGRLGMVAGLLGTTLVLSIAWLAVQRVLQVVPPTDIPMVGRFRIDGFPFAELGSAWHQTVSPLQGPYLAPFLRTTAVTVTAGLVDLALMAGAVAGTVLAPRGDRGRRLGAVALLLAVLLGPGLVVFNAVVQSIYVVIPPRYGLAIVPALVAAAVPALRTRLGLGLASALAIAAGGAALAALAFPAA